MPGQVQVVNRQSYFAIVAIHAGEIEPYTGIIAKQIAGTEYSFYVYQGKNRTEHVTSTEFYEPKLARILDSCYRVVSIHGEHETDDEFVMVGGLDSELASHIVKTLIDSGFEVRKPTKDLAGMNKHNVTNRGRSRKGVQLEISRGLRKTLSREQLKTNMFAGSIRSVLKTYTI